MYAVMRAGILTKLHPSLAVLPAVIIAMTVASVFAGVSGKVSAQEPVAADAAGNRLNYDEKAAQSIDGMLMCPVCPAETIDQAQVPIAKQMRRLVREKLAQGESREQILEYFAGVYGQDILAAPAKSGSGLVAWTVPVAGVFAALAAGFFVLRSMLGRQAQAVQVASGRQDAEEDLEPYLQAVDRDLGIEDIKSEDSSSAETPTSSEAGETRVNGGPNG
jgi:cytochrome c-type biogenesis protein CcmH